MTANFKSITLELFCKVYFEDVTYKELSDWLTLAKETNSEKIEKATAGKKFGSTLSEAVPQFLTIIKNIKISLPRSQKIICEMYLNRICYDYLNGQLELTDALNRTLKVLKESQDHKKLKKILDVFSELDLIDAEYAIKPILFSKKNIVKGKLSKVFLNYLEVTEKSKSRNSLKKLESKKLIDIYYFKNEKYNSLDLLIIKDILKRRKISEGEQEAIRQRIYKSRNGWRFN